METLIINEAPGRMFSVLLPVCDSSILSSILDPNTPFVSIFRFWSEEICNWIEQYLPPNFDASRRVESVQVKKLELDIGLSTADFLRILPFFSERGIELVQATKPLPRSSSIADLKPESKAHVFREVGIVLEFYLPHPREHALVTSPSKEVLERIIASRSKETSLS